MEQPRNLNTLLCLFLRQSAVVRASKNLVGQFGPYIRRRVPRPKPGTQLGADRKKCMKNMFFMGVGDVEYAWRIFLFGSCEPPVIRKCLFCP
jgi:hypothetical protein